jgi:hypothetical protein
MVGSIVRLCPVLSRSGLNDHLRATATGARDPSLGRLFDVQVPVSNQLLQVRTS